MIPSGGPYLPLDNPARSGKIRLNSKGVAPMITITYINGKPIEGDIAAWAARHATGQRPTLSREPRPLTPTETSTGYRDAMRDAGRGAQVR
jgi:hypothetical protein